MTTCPGCYRCVPVEEYNDPDYWLNCAIREEELYRTGQIITLRWAEMHFAKAVALEEDDDFRQHHQV